MRNKEIEQKIYMLTHEAVMFSIERKSGFDVQEVQAEIIRFAVFETGLFFKRN